MVVCRLYRAYDYLKGRTPKAKMVVAIIDADGDVMHKDLKNSPMDGIWMQPM
ncbi:MULTISPECIES: hypothetical protein [Butyricimonas]|uniref:hypothetical protein n=1 Tax=Butyricimonas TaxID=574697 RepID=UPI0012FABA53|nr:MULTISPECIES: hypothetical protein [Butyricimonas]